LYTPPLGSCSCFSFGFSFLERERQEVNEGLDLTFHVRNGENWKIFENLENQGEPGEL